MDFLGKSFNVFVIIGIFMAKYRLIGNTFPLSLIRRRVVIEMSTRDVLLSELKDHRVKSFWGHGNTLGAVNAWLGIDVTPETERPALSLNLEDYPQLDGEAFRQCFVLSPDYRSGYRPAIGVEVSPEDILGWQILKLTWAE